MTIISELSDWLTATPVSHVIGTTFWVVPVVQSIHILAISVVMASIALLDLRLAGVLGREQSMQNLTRHFYPWIWGALGVLLATGLVMIMSEPGRELLNWVFWTKMALITAAILFTAPVQRLLENCRYRDLPWSKRILIRGCAFTSLALWVGVVTCGRWIAYAGDRT